MDAFPNYNLQKNSIAIQIRGSDLVNHFTRVIKESERLIVYIYVVETGMKKTSILDVLANSIFSNKHCEFNCSTM